ncbi:hypothetical protein BD769DRAFT_1644634 [Suillus cothurnatus]|nr:hypothetical protein BD769DRAFT_1644634 [Suillus cothurnatus]
MAEGMSADLVANVCAVGRKHLTTVCCVCQAISPVGKLHYNFLFGVVGKYTLNTSYVMQICIQLVLAFSDNGTDALVFELNCTLIGIEKCNSGVQGVEVEYLRLLMVNNTSDGISSRKVSKTSALTMVYSAAMISKTVEGLDFECTCNLGRAQRGSAGVIRSNKHIQTRVLPVEGALETTHCFYLLSHYRAKFPSFYTWLNLFSAMIMHGRYIHVFISWLRRIVKTVVFHSYRSLLSVLLRLIRHSRTFFNGKERDFQQRLGAGLALSSQPVIKSVTLAMPSPDPNLCNLTPSPFVASCHVITLVPIVPEKQVKRYDRDVIVKDEYAAFKVEKGPFDCSEEFATVAGWEPLTHPEGALFFYYPEQRVFTDANVRDPVIAAKIGEAVRKAYRKLNEAQISKHPLVELVLELIVTDGVENWGYYFADHDKRVVFWFEDHISDPLMNKIRGVERKSHVRYALESQYWKHVELFPNKRSLPEDVVVKLKEIVMLAQAENITSETCLAPFASDEVNSMLGLVDSLMSSTNKEHEHSVWIAARFTRLFCNAKFVNFCGQPGARLGVDQSLYGKPNVRSKRILRVMNTLLFGSFDAQSKAIHRIWVDETMVQPRWKNFIDRLTTEWSGYTIYSTVMLAVDISFLAVQSVQTQIAATLLTYLSTLCVMGSLVVSLVLAGQVNDSRRSSAEEVASFMVGMSRSMLGLESLALMLSLPFALLIWACVSSYIPWVVGSSFDRMAFFAAALSVLIFRTAGVAAVSIASPIWFAIFCLAMWLVLAANNFHISHLRSWIIERVSRVTSPV